MFAHIIPKERDIVVFGAFLGNRYGDNSSALFEYCNSKKEEANPDQTELPFGKGL